MDKSTTSRSAMEQYKIIIAEGRGKLLLGTVLVVISGMLLASYLSRSRQQPIATESVISTPTPQPLSSVLAESVVLSSPQQLLQTCKLTPLQMEIKLPIDWSCSAILHSSLESEVIIDSSNYTLRVSNLPKTFCNQSSCKPKTILKTSEITMQIDEAMRSELFGVFNYRVNGNYVWVSIVYPNIEVSDLNAKEIENLQTILTTLKQAKL